MIDAYGMCRTTPRWAWCGTCDRDQPPTHTHEETTMPRPEHVTDLPDTDLGPIPVGSLNLGNIGTWAAPIFTALGGLASALDEAGYVTSSSYEGVQWHRPRTPDEITAALHAAQRNWDRSRDLYDAANVSGFAPDAGYQRTQVLSYCKTEDVPVPWSYEPAP